MLWLRRIAEVDQGCSLGLGSELWSLEKRDLVQGGVQLLVSWSGLMGVCVVEREWWCLSFNTVRYR